MFHHAYEMPFDPNTFKKINIVGTSGSGKSTFSKKLAEKMSAKYIGFDELHWLPNWQERSTEDLLAILKEELECEKWVLDGNYNKTLETKWKEVDAVVWLDLSFWTTFKQVLLRSLKRSFSRKELWPGTGNVESFRRTFFSKDSILWWMMTSYPKIKERYEILSRDPRFKHVTFIRLKSTCEVRFFLKLID